MGVALSLALLALALLVPTLLAFAALADTELAVAANQLRASQARALAESGFEYALRALSRAILADPSDPLLSGPVAPAPLDGRTFIALGLTGGFTVRAAHAAGGDPQVRVITSVGWMPTDDPTDPRAKAHRQITADVVAIPHPGARASCALCVNGSLTLSGNVAINGTNGDRDCGEDLKYGTVTRDATTVSGPVAISGGAGASAQGRPAADFDAVTFSPAVLDALKTLARRNGSYFGPGFPTGGRTSDGQATWSGRVAFDAANPLPDGVVFVDTTDGRPLDPHASMFPTLAGVRLGDGAVAPPAEAFRGWLVVNGSLEIAAGLALRGLVYALDSLTYQGGGVASIEGLALALNVQNALGSRIAPTGGGGMTVRFDCGLAAAAEQVPHGFVLARGSYREVAD
jgi:hypothetical protein